MFYVFGDGIYPEPPPTLLFNFTSKQTKIRCWMRWCYTCFYCCNLSYIFCTSSKHRPKREGLNGIPHGPPSLLFVSRRLSGRIEGWGSIKMKFRVLLRRSFRVPAQCYTQVVDITLYCVPQNYCFPTKVIQFTLFEELTFFMFFYILFKINSIHYYATIYEITEHV